MPVDSLKYSVLLSAEIIISLSKKKVLLYNKLLQSRSEYILTRKHFGLEQTELSFISIEKKKMHTLYSFIIILFREE